MTHDLLSTIVHEIGAEVTQVEITELRDSAFHALITLATPSGAVGVDARPSDAIALAVRADAPIFASDQVIEEGSVELPDEPEQVVEEFPEQVVEEFRAFLDEVSPDEFARRDGEQPDAGDVA
jgi:hypothetical protein